MKYLNLLLIIVVLAMTSVSCKEKQSTEEVNNGFIVEVGDVAPDFTAVKTDGDSVKLSDLRGKVVMLQFTASWCRVCRKEMPYIEKDIWQKHKNNPNFALLAIDREEPIEKVDQFIETIGITYPVATDFKSEIFTKYATKEAGVTRNVLIDKEGKIVYLTRLYEEPKFAKFVAVIDSILAE